MKSRFITQLGLVVLAAALWSAIAPAARAVEFTDNLIILLDSSGSMGGKKIEDAREAVKAAAANLPAKTHVGLLVFPRDKPQNWTCPLSPLHKAGFNLAVDGITTSGNTPLGTYMKVAADALLAARANQYGYGTYRLLVITDGDANNEPADLVSKFTADILSRGIRIDVIGVEMPGSHALATTVHSYRNVTDSKVLKKAIAEVLAEVGNQDDSRTGENPYDVLASIPAEMASAMIGALANSGNHPIGEAPPVTEVATEVAPAETPAANPPDQASTAPREFPWVILIFIIVGGICVCLILTHRLSV